MGLPRDESLERLGTASWTIEFVELLPDDLGTAAVAGRLQHFSDSLSDPLGRWSVCLKIDAPASPRHAGARFRFVLGLTRHHQRHAMGQRPVATFVP
jgi:hypothetical protein